MIQTAGSAFTILIADDDAEDVQLTRECFINNKLPVDINEACDGQFLMDRLESDAKNLPQLILLDLNMPRKGGFEALEEIKTHDVFRKIPVVIFSTSTASKDVEKAYQLGASCFITKPDNLDEWCDKIKRIGKFWVECVRVPA